MIVLMPILSFVMAQFVLIPKMKHALETSLKVAVDVSKKNTEHGAAKEHEETLTYSKTFKNIVANLSGAMQSRYIKISFTAEGNSAEFEELMTTNEAKIVDARAGHTL
jgi:flagellar basal body-associated protein FliL